jgi:hypothetical protein
MSIQQDFATPARLLDSELSWSAIIAGATVALATSLLLTLLAAGFGVSVAYGGRASHTLLAAFSPEFGAGEVVVQVLSAGFGGYIAGRLRHQWFSAHSDEAHFRDTAHGLLAWALSTVAGVVLAATVLIPYAEQLAAPAAAATVLTADEAARASNIAMQAAFFTAVGMLLSAFVAAVAARIGGLRNEDMHAKAQA